MTSDIDAGFRAWFAGGPDDPAEFYRRARAGAPVFRSELTGGWVAARYDDVRRVLTDEDCFGPLGGGAGSSIIHGRTILHMGGEEHRKKSAILARTLRNPRLLEGIQRNYVRAKCEELLSAFDPAGTVDLKAQYTTPMPLQVIAWLMDIAEAPNFRDTYDRIVAAGASNLTGDVAITERGVAARTELYAFVTPLIEARRAAPGDDLLSTLCSTEYEGERLSDDEIRAFCSFLLAAGVETTDRALSSLLRELVLRPDVWRELRDNRALVPAACAEGLRFRPAVHAVSRGVIADTELSGQPIPAGDRVLVLIGSANRDPAVFADPDRFDVHRFAANPDREFSAKAQIQSFGYGRHLCTGSLLAKLEMVEGLNLLLDRYSGATFTDGVPPDHGSVLRSPAHVRVQLHT